MATNIITKISYRAKQIRKAHPSMKWQSAIKQASKELKGSTTGSTVKKRGAAAKKRKPAKKSVYRQTGTSSTPHDRARKAKLPGKRISKSGRVYYERRKNRSDVPGSMSGTGTSAYNEMILRRLREDNENLARAERTLQAMKEKHKWLRPGGEKKIVASNISKHKKYIASIKANSRMLKRLMA